MDTSTINFQSTGMCKVSSFSSLSRRADSPVAQRPPYYPVPSTQYQPGPLPAQPGHRQQTGHLAGAGRWSVGLSWLSSHGEGPESGAEWQSGGVRFGYEGGLSPAEGVRSGYEGWLPPAEGGPAGGHGGHRVAGLSLPLCGGPDLQGGPQVDTPEYHQPSILPPGLRGELAMASLPTPSCCLLTNSWRCMG